MTGSTSTQLAEAREVFGSWIITPDDVGRLLDTEPRRLANGDPAVLESVPYASATLRAARARGDFLVFRTAMDGAAPLTLMRLMERFPEAVQARLMKGVGYQLKDEWTIGQEPFATAATPSVGWRLVHGAPVTSTCNLTYEEQSSALTAYAESIGLANLLSRRSAIEAAYDTVLLGRARGVRLLEDAWDWSDTPTEDGGYITVGEFGADGLSILGYSRAVRFGTLGICPQC